jgi:hypothetical protein
LFRPWDAASLGNYALFWGGNQDEKWELGRFISAGWFGLKLE